MRRAAFPERGRLLRPFSTLILFGSRHTLSVPLNSPLNCFLRFDLLILSDVRAFEEFFSFHGCTCELENLRLL